MKYSYVLLLAALLTGCKPAHKTDVVIVPRKEDKIILALDVLNQRTDSAAFRRALDLVNLQPGLADAVNQQPVSERVKKLGLPNLQRTTFEAGDAEYLEECYYFREVLDQLDFATASPEQKVRFGWQWIALNVPLADVGRQDLAALPILQRGYGSPADRLVVALPFFRQAKIPTALFLRPDSKDYRLGVLAKEWILIDLAGDAQTPLVKMTDWDKADVRLPVDPFSPAPRFAYLQAVFADREPQETVLLAQSIETRLAELEKAFPGRTDFGTEAGPKSAEDTRVHPFLTTWTRLQYDKLGLFAGLPKTAQARLLKILEANQRDLWRKYAKEPGDRLLEGKIEQALRELAQADQLLEDVVRVSALTEKMLFDAKVWRTRFVQAFLAEQNPGPEGAKRMAELLSEDKYLVHLLAQGDDGELNKHVPGTMSRILFAALRHPLALATHLHLGQAWHTSAIRWQMLAERSNPPVASVQQKSRDAWENAATQWATFLQTSAPFTQGERLPELKALWDAGRHEDAVTLFEGLALEDAWLRHARKQLAAAQTQLGKIQEAAMTLKSQPEAFAQRQDVAELANFLLKAPEGARFADRLRRLLAL